MAFQKLSKYMSKPRVYVIRHGSTDLNKEGGVSNVDRIRGWIDIPLNEKGCEDAAKAAQKLKGEHPAKIYCSDLIRAVQTADIIDDQFHVPLIKDSHLRPWNVGIYSGQPSKEAVPILNQHVENETAPIKNGESFKDFRVRFLSDLKRIIDEAKATKKTIFVVAHFRNMKTCEAWVKAGQPNDLHIELNGYFDDNYKPGNIFEIPMDDESGESMEKK